MLLLFAFHPFSCSSSRSWEVVVLVVAIGELLEKKKKKSDKEKEEARGCEY